MRAWGEDEVFGPPGADPVASARRIASGPDPALDWIERCQLAERAADQAAAADPARLKEALDLR